MTMRGLLQDCNFALRPARRLAQVSLCCLTSLLWACGGGSSSIDELVSSSANSSSASSASSLSSSSSSSMTNQNTPPDANAGSDQTVDEGTLVQLAASGSDAEGAVMFSWTQTSGPAVLLSSISIANPSFTAPQISENSILSFQLMVTDSDGATAVDSIQITVRDRDGSNAAISSVVAMPLAQAVGFPAGFVYDTLNDRPAMGQNGHIAFSGKVRNSAINASPRIDAVWGGLPGQLTTLIKFDDTVAGAPDNIFFSGQADFLTVTSSGHVGMHATFYSKTIPVQHSLAILANVEGITRMILRTGDQAPGFVSGTTITGFWSIVFSDGGMLILGQTTESHAIWFWDFDSVQLIAGAGQQVAGFPNCTFSPLIPSFDSHVIHDSGTAVFSMGLATTDSASTECELTSPLMWREGILSPALGIEPVVPNMPNTRFSSIRGAFLMVPATINDKDEISFHASVFDADASKTSASIWQKTPNETPKLITLLGESLPENLASTITAITHSGINNSGQAVVFVQGSGDIRNAILRGQPRDTVPYSNTSQVSESQLSVVAHNGMQVPGHSSSTIFGTLNAPAVTHHNDVLFTATVVDTVNPGPTIKSIWRADASGMLTCVLCDGQVIHDNGTARTIRFGAALHEQRFLVGVTGNGLSVQHSETHQIIARASLEPGGMSIVVTTYD